MFHLLAFSESVTSNNADTDVDGVEDAEFSRRNGHYIFSEQYNVLGMYANAASLARARLNVPSINGIGRHFVEPIDVSATIPSRTYIADYRDYPIPMPMNEEIAFEINGTNAMAEVSNGFMWIAPPTWNRNLPRGIQRLLIRFTAAAAGTAQSWGAEAALTLADNLKGGWYAVVGAMVFDAGSLAFRLNFRNASLVNGRKLRPGALCKEAIANMPWMGFLGGMGVWGFFNTFEPPTIQILANATAASTQEGRLDVIYLGERAAF